MLINLDQKGLYYRSVHAKDDVDRALSEYVESGGHFIQCGMGTPFRFGLEARNRAWVRAPSDPGLNRRLEMDIVDVADRRHGAVAFDLPPHPERELVFTKDRGGVAGCFCPDRIEFPAVKDCRFRPITADFVDDPARFKPLYHLRDDRGREYGAAAAWITGDGGRGARLYVSAALAQASIGGEPALKVLLPEFLSQVWRMTSSNRIASP